MHQKFTNMLSIYLYNTDTHNYTNFVWIPMCEIKEMLFNLFSHITRGIMQGCQLSDLLFVLIILKNVAARLRL